MAKQNAATKILSLAELAAVVGGYLPSPGILHKYGFLFPVHQDHPRPGAFGRSLHPVIHGSHAY